MAARSTGAGTDATLAGQAIVLEAIAQGQPLVTTLDLLTRTVEELSPGMRASVLRVHDGHLWHGAAPSLPPDYSAAIDGLAIGPVAGSCGTAAHHDRLVVVEDVLVDPLWEPFRDLARQHGFRSCWSQPIHAPDGSVLGTFALYYDQPRRPSDGELDLIRMAARLAAIALERDRAERDVTASEQRFRLLFRSSPVGMALTDRARLLLEANEALVRLLGRASTEVTGRALEELVAPASAPVLREATDAVLDAGGLRTFEVTLVRPDDEPGWAHVSLSRVEVDGAARCIAVFEDVTERRQLEQLRARQRELELAAQQEQTRLREELLAGVSHDMQTPLASITGAVALLRRDLADAGLATATTVEVLARQTDSLAVLVQQFLDYSRLQVARSLHVPLRPVAVAQPIHRVVERHAHQRTIEVHLPWPSPTVHADGVRVQQVLANLVANAIAFSDAPVVIAVEETGGHVHVHVDDRGVGLPDPDQPDIVFDQFFRGPRTADIPGTGLGLWVSREVARALGGQLTAHPRDGGGSRFTLSLPSVDGAAPTTL